MTSLLCPRKLKETLNDIFLEINLRKLEGNKIANKKIKELGARAVSVATGGCDGDDSPAKRMCTYSIDGAISSPTSMSSTGVLAASPANIGTVHFHNCTIFSLY